MLNITDSEMLKETLAVCDYLDKGLCVLHMADLFTDETVVHMWHDLNEALDYIDRTLLLYGPEINQYYGILVKARDLWIDIMEAFKAIVSTNGAEE